MSKESVIKKQIRERAKQIKEMRIKKQSTRPFSNLRNLLLS